MGTGRRHLSTRALLLRLCGAGLAVSVLAWLLFGRSSHADAKRRRCELGAYDAGTTVELNEVQAEDGFSLLLCVDSPVLLAGAAVFLPYR